MAQQDSASIVVAVDGTEEGLRAVDYAAGAAEREGCSLVLVHVVRPHPLVLPVMVAADAETEVDVGSAALSDARARVRARSSGVEVQHRLLRGTVRHQLPRAAASARLLVLGRTPLSRIERLAAGSVCIPILARAAVPVVSVPQSWTASKDGVVVAAASDGAGAAIVLRAAFEEARATGASVLAIRSIDEAMVGSEALPAALDVDGLLADAERAFAAELAEWAAEFPDVCAEMRVTTADPTPTLLEAAESAQLVVAASRRRGELLHPRVGSTARALLAKATCPVLIVPAERPHLPPRPSLRVGYAQRGDAPAY